MNYINSASCTLLTIALLACTSSDETGDGGASSSSSGQGGSGGSTSSSSSTSSGTGGTTSSGSGGAGGTGGSGIGGSGGGGGSQSCNVSVTEPTLCLTDASGSPGDTITVDVHLLLPAGCAGTTQSGGLIDFGGAPMVLANPANLGSPPGQCIQRAENNDGMSWFYFTASAVGSACPDLLPPGLNDTIELELDPAMATGTYPLNWINGSMGDNYADEQCRSDGLAATRGGIITVY